MKKGLLVIASVAFALGVISLIAAVIASIHADVNLGAETVGAVTVLFDPASASYGDTPSRTLTYSSNEVTLITGQLPNADIVVLTSDVDEITVNLYEAAEGQYDVTLNDGLLNLTLHPARSMVVLGVDFGDTLRFFGLGTRSAGRVEILLPEALSPKASRWATTDDFFEIVVSGGYVWLPS